MITMLFFKSYCNRIYILLYEFAVCPATGELVQRRYPVQHAIALGGELPERIVEKRRLGQNPFVYKLKYVSVVELRRTSTVFSGGRKRPVIPLGVFANQLTKPAEIRGVALPVRIIVIQQQQFGRTAVIYSFHSLVSFINVTRQRHVYYLLRSTEKKNAGLTTGAVVYGNHLNIFTALNSRTCPA